MQKDRRERTQVPGNDCQERIAQQTEVLRAAWIAQAAGVLTPLARIAPPMAFVLHRPVVANIARQGFAL